MAGIRAPRTALAAAIGALTLLLPVAAQRVRADALFDFPCSSGGTAVGDFNADGRPDVAIGAPGDDLDQRESNGTIVQGATDAGSISVVYSNENGPDPEFAVGANTPKFFSQDTPGITGNSGPRERFGFSLASGNFDGANGQDLAVGVPGESSSAGAVHVLYSGAAGIGLAAGANRLITQSTAGVEGKAEIGDQFGYAVAAGNVNGDRFDDLIVGAPTEDVGSRRDAGVIHVIYGTPSGLDPDPPAGIARSDQLFDQGPGPVAIPEVGKAESGDFFGASLAVGRFDDTGAETSDVAVGSPGEDIRGKADAGAVRLLYSRGASGLTGTGADFIHQDSANVDGSTEAGDRFSCALSAGDFDGDGDKDLAVGVPGEALGDEAAAGVVHALYNSGKKTGIDTESRTRPPLGGAWSPPQLWTEDDGGIPGISLPDDHFGASLASANFDSDPADTDDLAIGLPYETVMTKARAGSVRVIYGFEGAGLTDDKPNAFAQSPAFPGQAGGFSPVAMVLEAGDKFGSALSAADFDGDGDGDLVVAAPGEDCCTNQNFLVEEVLKQADAGYVDAGVVHFIEAPFPAPTTAPTNDVFYRTDGQLSRPEGSDNRIKPVPEDPSYSNVLTGDFLGASLS